MNKSIALLILVILPVMVSTTQGSVPEDLSGNLHVHPYCNMDRGTQLVNLGPAYCVWTWQLLNTAADLWLMEVVMY